MLKKMNEALPSYQEGFALQSYCLFAGARSAEHPQAPLGKGPEGLPGGPGHDDPAAGAG